MKKLFIFLFMLPSLLFAQKTTYTTHTVAAKESLSSIGRAYNINPKALAKLNNIAYEKGLTIGQVLKVPSAGGAATAQVKAPVAEVKTAPVKTVASGTSPIYHTVAKKETLYHISTLYKNASVADIKKWNHLTTDGLTEGVRIIVGYGNSPVAQAEPAPRQDPPVVKIPETKAAPVKTVPVVTTDNTAVTETKTPVTTTATGANFNGGFFKTQYNKTPGKAEETGTAGIFKSTSGWEDGKYYCLHNGALAGSIIKITNTANNKSVYAKVLDIMPDLKQNNDLVLRISNAAAEALGAGSTNFTCTISF